MQKGIIKHLVIASAASAFIMNAYAVAPGFYLGLMMGPASNTGKNQQVGTSINPLITTTAKPKSTQFGTRLFMGYDIGRYAGVEGGLTYFSNINYTSNLPPCAGLGAHVRDFDLLVKGMFPLSMFKLYAKAGMAATYVTTSGALNGLQLGQCGKSTYKTKFDPTVSIGASYDLSQNWVTDLSYNRLMVGGIVSNVDFFALGISYHFVDKFCGQFLCDD